MIHQMKLWSSSFEMIKSGMKIIEMRLYDDKRQMIHKGDVIEFINTSTGEKLLVIVLQLHIFNNFDELYAKFDKTLIGYKKEEDPNPSDMNLYYSNEMIYQYGVVGIEVRLVSQVTAGLLVDMGICPTCFDKENNYCLYGNKMDKMLYENEDFECFFVENPRAIGHIVISSKQHFKDMMDIPDDLCNTTFIFAKKMMKIIKAVYQCESVYLCTMCDGPMNHFHIQLIPRYADEIRGSSNFVKERKFYIHNQDKIKLIKRYLLQD